MACSHCAASAPHPPRFLARFDVFQYSKLHRFHLGSPCVASSTSPSSFPALSLFRQLLEYRFDSIERRKFDSGRGTIERENSTNRISIPLLFSVSGADVWFSTGETIDRSSNAKIRTLDYFSFLFSVSGFHAVRVEFAEKRIESLANWPMVKIVGNTNWRQTRFTSMRASFPCSAWVCCASTFT